MCITIGTYTIKNIPSFFSFTGKKRKIGKKHERTDHLGNVSVVVSDRKIPVDGDNDGTVDYYAAEVLSATDYYPGGMLMPGRNYNANSYRYGAANGQEKVDEISGSGNHYTAMYWEYDPRLIRRWNLDPKPTVGVSDYSVYLNNPIWNTDKLGDKPTKKEAAAISAHVYGDKKDDILRGGWKVSDRTVEGTQYNSDEGLKSNLYERTITKGKHKGETEYVYATAGTEDWTDVVADAVQPSGFSTQYDQSVQNARLISGELGKNTELTYTGHSLGGGEAVANAYATGRDAITFNAAGVSAISIAKYGGIGGLFSAPKIDAYIMRTDPLNLIQNNSLLLPDVDGTRHYEMSYSKSAITNGHSIDNFLRIYKINPSFYKK